MQTTNEDITAEEVLEKLTIARASLLEAYKSLKEPLEYAQNDFEKGLIEEKRELLAHEIRQIASQMEELQG